jgi:hypothetical protein
MKPFVDPPAARNQVAMADTNSGCPQSMIAISSRGSTSRRMAAAVTRPVSEEVQRM